MKTLKESLLSDEDEVVDNVSLKPIIEKWLKDNKIHLYKINKDNTIDLKQGIIIREDLPQYIQFNKVEGVYRITGPVTTLRGCPREVIGDFWMRDCPKLKNIDYFPEKIEDCLIIEKCDELISLKGVENTHVESDINLSKLYILTLRYFPKCNSDCNISIEELNVIDSLIGIPDEIGKLGLYYCKKLNNINDIHRIKYRLSIYGCPKIPINDIKKKMKDVKGQVILDSKDLK